MNFSDRVVNETSGSLPSSSSLPSSLSSLGFAFPFPSLLASSFTQCPSHYRHLSQPHPSSPAPGHLITATRSAAGNGHRAVHIFYLTTLSAWCAQHPWHLTNVRYDMLLSFTPKGSRSKVPNAGIAPRDTYLQPAAYGLRPIKMQSPH